MPVPRRPVNRRTALGILVLLARPSISDMLVHQPNEPNLAVPTYRTCICLPVDVIFCRAQ
jgi:hypothetical protein